MASKHVVGSRATVQRYCDLRNKAEDYPSRGVHHGRGRHVDIPDAPPGHGWSLYSPRKHPGRDEYACTVEKQPANTATMSVEEIAELAAGKAAAVDLDATWTAEELPTKEPTK
jgi:hypothetical protein